MSHDELTCLPQKAQDPPAVKDLLQEIAGLRAALTSRDMIGQAKGIIRILLHCDADTAFTVLNRISQDTNNKIAYVAMLLTECSATAQSLPPEIRASWHRRTEHLAPAEAAM